MTHKEIVERNIGLTFDYVNYLIENKEEFKKVVLGGLKFIEENDAIVTLGINPTHPETGYGYIQFIDDSYMNVEANGEGPVNIYKVKTFAEKPTLEIANEFLKSGDFLWNSGMFIFRSDVILKEIKKSLPDLHHQLLKIEKDIHSNKFHTTLDKTFREIKGIEFNEPFLRFLEVTNAKPVSWNLGE